MSAVPRGVIKNRQFRSRIADMSGLTFGKISPTDLDAFMDFGDKLFVFVESKYQGGKLKWGQELALNRLCDACHKPPQRVSVAFLTSYEDEGDIDFAQTKVTRFRFGGKWHPPKTPGSSLVDGVKAFLEKYVGNPA